MQYNNLTNQDNLIKDVVLFPLKVNRDQRGFLIETLKDSWQQVYGKNRSFTQNYFSLTLPGQARDKNQWHVHNFQEDRFVVISGNIVVALFDNRPESATNQQLNMVQMGEMNKDDGQFLLLIPPKVLHGFCVIGNKSAIITNFPTKLYNPLDEGRINHQDIKVKFPDKNHFNWEQIQKDFI